MLLSQPAHNINTQPIEQPYYLSDDFKETLNLLIKDAENKIKKGLPPSQYQQQTELLLCYSAAQTAIKKIIS